MTPAQRKYDLDLASNMMRMANWIEPRSRKVSETLRLGAQRITALVSEQQIDTQVMNFDLDKRTTQPASTPTHKRR